MKQWKCTICGYIHQGDAPPEECPVCGADKSKFIEIKEEPPSVNPEVKSRPVIKAMDTKAPPRFFEWVSEQLTKLHAHPISVHIPNGVLPVGVVFLMPAIFFGLPGLEQAAFYNLMAVVFAMPLVIFFGVIDWKNRYKGKMTPLFRSKMICGVIVTFVGLLLLIWRMIDPGLASSSTVGRLVYLLAHLLMLAAAVYAGYLGGKLVFRK